MSACTLIDRTPLGHPMRVSEDDLGLTVEKKGSRYLLRVSQGDESITYEHDDEDKIEFFLRDLAACACTVADYKKRLSMRVEYTRPGDPYWNDIDTPLYINVNFINIIIWSKPSSRHDIPVSVNVSFFGTDWITLRTTYEEIHQFGTLLKELIEDR